MKRAIRWVLLLYLTVLASSVGRAQSLDPTKQLARDIFKQLVEINTTDSVGNVTTAAEAMAARLRSGGFSEADLHVAGPNARKKSLVVRFRGTGKRKPILFIGHLDVVEALRSDWTTDPFEFIEKDGFFYGRGTEDMKEGDAILVTNFIRLRKEGFLPDRDLILALTADEEGGSSNGVDWLLKQHPDWIDAEYCINLDGGEFEMDHGKRTLAGIQASEKVYVDFQFESLNPGGHSSVPTPDNAIYHLAGALVRLQSFSFPLHMNEITRNYFERNAAFMTGQVSADMKAVAKDPPDSAAVQRLSESPYFNSLLHTTCVATMLSGGHAPNALPQTARANVNCRIFPGEDPQDVLRTLERIANDPKVKISIVPQIGPDGKVAPAVPVPPSPLLPEVITAMEQTLGVAWPGVPWVATMSTGATDGRITRIAGIPTYGISCMFFDVNDDRAHGKDERVGVQDFYDGVDFNYKLIRALSTPQ
ncbi:MAG TPA: M20/M25/M40 family metallo-hydrolase [Methylomirabilota bacterium]|nr:M20/M25/M40 family metallo-hydrolase [Methylomirabilota bacterium]